MGEGSTFTVTCEAMGYPPPLIVWTRTNGILSDRVSLSNNVTSLTKDGFVSSIRVNLTITNASRKDTGEYQCFANNSIGSVYSNYVRITVKSKLMFKCSL